MAHLQTHLYNAHESRQHSVMSPAIPPNNAAVSSSADAGSTGPAQGPAPASSATAAAASLQGSLDNLPVSFGPSLQSSNRSTQGPASLASSGILAFHGSTAQFVDALRFLNYLNVQKRTLLRHAASM